MQRSHRWPFMAALGGVAAACCLMLLPGCHPSSSAPPASAVALAAEHALASAKGRVDIEGGVIRLAARRDGIISEVLVEEGARVKRGQVLALLDDETARRSFDLAKREVRQAELTRNQTVVELAAAEREFLRLQSLVSNGVVPRQEFDRAADARALAKVAVQSAHASVDTAQARLKVAAREIDERKVVAPRDGQIIQRQARPGNGVSTLNVTPLFLFVPDVPRIVRAELEEQYLGVVMPAQPAEILLEADPGQTWRGTVLRLGRVVGARTPSDDPTEKQDNRVVEVVVALENPDSLLIGQHVVVRFLAPPRSGAR